MGDFVNQLTLDLLFPAAVCFIPHLFKISSQVHVWISMLSFLNRMLLENRMELLFFTLYFD